MISSFNASIFGTHHILGDESTFTLCGLDPNEIARLKQRVNNALLLASAGVVNDDVSVSQGRFVVRLLQELSAAEVSPPPFAATLAARLALLSALQPIVAQSGGVQRPYRSRPHGGKRDYIATKELGLSILSVLVQSANTTDKKAVAGPLSVLLQTLEANTTPLSMFPDWYPPPLDPGVETLIDMKSVEASSSLMDNPPQMVRQEIICI